MCSLLRPDSSVGRAPPQCCFYRALDDTAPEYYADPESIALLFPSSLLREMLIHPDMRELAMHDCHSRSQANDALAEICCLCCLTYPRLWLISRSTIIFNWLFTNIYHIVHSVSLALDSDGSWSRRLKELHLHSDNIQGPGQNPNDPLDSHFEASWIYGLSHIHPLR